VQSLLREAGRGLVSGRLDDVSSVLDDVAELDPVAPASRPHAHRWPVPGPPSALARGDA
jgi:hypothetical protein